MKIFSKQLIAVSVALVMAALFGSVGVAVAETGESDGLEQAQQQLRSVYSRRADLQALFASDSWLPTDPSKTGDLTGLEDWARRYGCHEQAELTWYCSDAARQSFLPRALQIRSSETVPVRTADSTDFAVAGLGSTAVLAVDLDSRQTVFELNADSSHADAVVPKMVTASVAIGSGLAATSPVSLVSDEVGGIQLAAATSADLTVGDLIFAALTGSANNAALSLAREVDSSDGGFTARMNALGKTYGLNSTVLTGPTGIEDGQLTSVRDAAAVLIESMSHDDLRRALSTARTTVGGVEIENRNELLTDPDNGLYVMGGQVGYLRATGWHLVVDLRPVDGSHRLVMALAGAPTKEQLFKDATDLSGWIWSSHEWRVDEGGDDGEEVESAAGSVSRPLVQSSNPDLLTARGYLRTVFEKRGDLQALFDATSWLPIDASKTGDIANLEDWARRFGQFEHDALWWYGTAASGRVLVGGTGVLASSPAALQVRSAAAMPVRLSNSADFRPATVTADSVLVIDVPTRRVLLEEKADRLHPVASITKLMTGLLAVEKGINFSSRQVLLGEDEIGGARLRVPVGTSMTFADLMYSMLVGSANNAAHAIGRIAGAGDMDGFVATMNARADQLGLVNTEFADPSGLNVHNVSTARELAALALETWDHEQLQRICTTARYSFMAGTEEHTLINTNQLLTDPDNGLYVLGGKTGYLIESKWNLVTELRDDRNRPVLVVVLGSGSRADLFRDAEAAARWTWANYQW